MSECLVRHLLVVLSGLIPLIFKVVQNSSTTTDKLGNKGYFLSYAGFAPAFVASVLVVVICLLAVHYPYLEERFNARKQEAEADPNYS